MDAKLDKVPDVGADDIELRLLLEALYLRYHYDFRSYAPASLKRRLANALPRFKCATLSQLQDRLLHDPSILASLLDTLTVQVSELFRDPSYFQAIREQVLPVLRTYPSLKMWVAGCSNGEEAYSLAILLRVEGLLERTMIYATDINSEALRKAEAGVYAAESLPLFSSNYLQAGMPGALSDHYTAAYGRVVFDRTLKQSIVFSDHSLATDTVFAEVQLVSCRNTLIYFDRALQDRAVGLFRDALSRRGFLGIGAKESLKFGLYASAFEEFAGKERVYRKREAT
ncbi:MAG TPA: CheR family methyltransferase [Steroidobacteraceae bacterium]|jgi:chemotaxis protein methyltransferase CheR|nr:CheR family methyltransferase [Steroidobacteraceae bacterium]